MRSRQDDTRQEILAKAVEVADPRGEPGGPQGDTLRRLLNRYYQHVPVEDLTERDPVDIYGLLMSQYRFAGRRPQGTASIRAFTPTVDSEGWSAGGHTVVEVVTDDMPFIVDSLTMELSRQDRGIHLVVHPQMRVERDVAGNLVGVEQSEQADTIAESWMHIEVDRESSPEGLRAIEAGLGKVLVDVREAVEDWQKMRDQAMRVVEDLEKHPPPLSDAEVEETSELLRWLAADHFTFLGYREYVLERADGADMLRAVPGSGLGILRADQDMSTGGGPLPPEVSAKAREKRLLIITKANSRSSVHRPAYLDYIGVKVFGDDGSPCGERRFLGLFTSAAYTESVRRIPVLRRKVADVLDSSGFPPMSHSAKALMDTLETYPRDELFQTTEDQLLPIAASVLHLQERRQIRLFVRRDDYGRYLSCLVYLPRDRYTTQVRLRLQEILRDTLSGETVDYTARVGESVLARVHFVVRMAPGQTIPDFDLVDLERRLSEAARTWNDDFNQALHDQLGEEEAPRLAKAYGDAFPEAYKEDFPARTAVTDLRRLDALDPEGGLSLSLYDPIDVPRDMRRFKIYRTGSPMSLSQVLPHLTQMGVEVVDERPYELVSHEGRAWIYDFGLRYPAEVELKGRDRALFQDAFEAVWRGRAESDGFNALVTRAALTWRQVSVLRAYAKYLRQAGTAFSQDYIEDALLANTAITASLVGLFETRFDPDFGEDSEARGREVSALEDRITKAIEEVASLDEDRILRSFLTLVRASLRTNYFQLTEDGVAKDYISLKLEPTAIPDLPQPRPRYEIFVCSPRVEGVHLRFGPVARGGLRWSDRREDFRTEVLGLVKAQMVKNAVIVPAGSKGGFFCKELPDPQADREAWQAEGLACYRTFICGLLDVTDNLVDGRTAPPDRVVRHDGDDSYLVVAADKGTATFSDTANGIAQEYGFWLGDAFASGGSAGYDHKAMGITARGAWESVRRHFREMGVNPQTDDFTCVGIGDMSGDVFGNGMLLSEHVRLLAAFDHRHVFLDPDPDPRASFRERRRLFEQPRSSWADYDTDLISAGGGVHARTAKSVPVTPQVREALGLEDEVSSMSPAELIRAILLAPADLLWNGGIGTYVKASTETNAEVGDKANDAIRVDGQQLRCRCVGEGGNLGLTQLGRIEYARKGGRVNTDFIDNSAGVDTSDHEVNIKILLDKVAREGDLTGKQRNRLLEQMTDEVAQLVLEHNYEQNLALASAQRQSPPLLHVHADWIRRLEKAGRLNRKIEGLPTQRQLDERRGERKGLSTPELSVLLAYTKIVLEQELLEGNFADDPYLRDRLAGYFPSAMRERFREQMAQHPLRREIIVTQVVNELVNNAGITFFHRLSGETGAPAADLARANIAAREIYGLPGYLEAVRELDHRVDADVQTTMRLEARTLAERASRWLVNNRRPPIDITATVEHFHKGVGEVVAELPDVLAGRDAALYKRRRDRLVDKGVPEDLAICAASLSPAYTALGIVENAKRTKTEPLVVARVHFALGEQLLLGMMLERIVALPREDRWQTMARVALRDDLHGVHALLTAQVLSDTSGDQDADDRVSEWVHGDGVVVQRATKTLREICEGERADLARLSVGLRVVRTLLTSPS